MTFRDLRKSKFRTAKEFAEKINMPTPRVQKWECNSSSPKTADLTLVAQALEVSVEQLLKCFERKVTK